MPKRTRDSRKDDPVEPGMRKRKKPRRFWLFVGALVVGCALIALLAAPSVICNSPIADSLLRSSAAKYGWKAEALGIKIGWLSPLQLEDVKLTGASGETRFAIDTVSSSMTLLDAISQNVGTITIAGIRGEFSVLPGATSLEDDLKQLLGQESDNDSPDQPSQNTDDTSTDLALTISDVNLLIRDAIKGNEWTLETDAVKAEVVSGIPSARADVKLTDPAGTSGVFAFELHPQEASLVDGSVTLSSNFTTVPLSALSLFVRRFPEYEEDLPAKVSGQASGIIRATLNSDGHALCDFQQMRIQHLVVSDARLSDQPWNLQRGEINGTLEYRDTFVVGENLSFSSEVGSGTLTGAIHFAKVGADLSVDEDLSWFEMLDGSANLQFDLARIIDAAPGLLPVREQATIESAMVRGKISGGDDGSGFITNISFESDPIRGRSRGRSVMLEPIQLELAARPAGKWIAAERLQLRSIFANATASGDLEKGQANFNVDLGRLASMVSPLVDLPEAGLGGNASGEIHWAAESNNAWKLNGHANAADLAVTLPSGQTIKEPSIDVKVDALGTWGGDRLTQLARSAVLLRNASQSWDITLEQPVENPSTETTLPIRAQGSGRLSALVDLLRPWLPDEVGLSDGGFEATIRGDFALADGKLRTAKVSLDDGAIVWDGIRYSQTTLNVDFDGILPLDLEAVSIRSLTLQGNAAAMNIQGDVELGGSSALQFAWRADLQRLRESQNSLAHRFAPVQLTNFQQGNAADEAGYLVQGMIEGRASLTGEVDQWQLEIDASGENLELLYAMAEADAQVRAPNTSSSEKVWAEPTASVLGTIKYDSKNDRIETNQLKVVTPWSESLLDIVYSTVDGVANLSIRGPAKLNGGVVSQRLQELTGQAMRIDGVSETPIELVARIPDDGPVEIDAKANVTWDSANIAGVEIGEASIPVQLQGDTIAIQSTTIQLSKGRLNLNAAVHYAAEPMRIEMQPGMIVEGVELETEMTRGWLKYVAPLVADATSVQGTFNLDLDKAVIYPSDPMRNVISGKLGIDHGEVGPGPIAKNVVALVSQIKSLSSAGSPLSAGTDWVELPGQRVEFSMQNGNVTHQRLLMKLDDVYVLSSGTATLDGRLNLMAQIPIEDTWAGGDLQKAGLVGQAFTVPIDGTFSRPSLDSSGVQKSIAQLGVQAIEQTAKNALQKEISRGLQRIFGNR